MALGHHQQDLAEQAQEFELFKNYIHNVAPTHPRYSQLGQFNVHAPTDLTDHLGFWNATRVMRLIREEKEIYPLYKEAVALATRCSTSEAEIQASQGLQWHLSFTYPHYFRKQVEAPLGSISDYITQIFEPLGVDTSDWSMDFGSGGRFAFFERFGTPSEAIRIFRAAREFVIPEDAHLDKISCDKLRTTMVEKLDKAFASGFQESLRSKNLRRYNTTPSHQDILNRCMQCHTGDSSGWIPQIPFDHPEHLAQALVGTRAKSGRPLLQEIGHRTSEVALHTEQMPPSKRLSAKERNILMEYLSSLVQPRSK